MIMQRLSLLARGTRYRWRNAELLVRFIPADAGNTRQRMRPPTRSPVYPRWRGEHLRGTRERCFGIGLSPLARGTLPETFHELAVTRFIPAGAGNTIIPSHAPCSHPVYPRWRGEHPFALDPVLRMSGLSPLARGTPLRSRSSAAHERFIPAGAGNTQFNPLLTLVNPVYPRWRGEHSRIACCAPSYAGLSPLARGTRGLIA